VKEDFQKGDLLKVYEWADKIGEAGIIHSLAAIDDKHPLAGMSVVFLSYCDDKHICNVFSPRGKMKISTFFLYRCLDI